MLPLSLIISSLLERARSRVGAALDRRDDTGALTLEWIVIAGILVAAAVAAGVVFKNAISTELSKLP
jgi:Flp pilus assembly pilin Flp